MANELNAVQLQKMTNQLVDVLTSEEFLVRLREIRNAPSGERLKKASSLLSIEGLRSAGVALPATMRVSSRYFEDHEPASPASLVGQIEKSDPTFAQELREKHPNVYEKLLTLAQGDGKQVEPTSGQVTGQITPFGVCAGGGVNGVCACAGQP
jgi:hypothetical protein